MCWKPFLQESFVNILITFEVYQYIDTLNKVIQVNLTNKPKVANIKNLVSYKISHFIQKPLILVLFFCHTWSNRKTFSWKTKVGIIISLDQV